MRHRIALFSAQAEILRLSISPYNLPIKCMSTACSSSTALVMGSRDTINSSKSCKKVGESPATVASFPDYQTVYESIRYSPQFFIVGEQDDLLSRLNVARMNDLAELMDLTTNVTRMGDINLIHRKILEHAAHTN